MSRPLLMALALAAALCLSACGVVRRDRPTGPFDALRTTRPLPAGTRLGAGDVEVVRVTRPSLPGARSMPRSPEEIRGAAVRSRRPAGTLLLDEHLNLHPLSPEPVAARLPPGEAGWIVPVAGLPDAVEPGAGVRLQGIAAPLRLLDVGPPTSGARAVALAAPLALLHEQVRRDPDYPLTAVELLPPSPRRTPPTTRPPLPEVVVAARSVPAGQEIVRQDLAPLSPPGPFRPWRIPADLTGALGRRYRDDLHPGDLLLAGELTPVAEPDEAVILHFDGLHPDWLHPGTAAVLMRAHPRSGPLSIEVVDVLRNAPGNPARLEVRPALGYRWSDAHVGRTYRESGSRRWHLLVER